MLNVDLSSFEVVSDSQIMQSGNVGIAIGRVIRARFKGGMFDVRYWYNWSAPDCPLYKIDSVPVSSAS